MTSEVGGSIGGSPGSVVPPPIQEISISSIAKLPDALLKVNLIAVTPFSKETEKVLSLVTVISGPFISCHTSLTLTSNFKVEVIGLFPTCPLYQKLKVPVEGKLNTGVSKVSVLLPLNLPNPSEGFILP